MTRLYGRREVGERVVDYVPDTRWESLTILSSLRLDGTTEALVFEGALNGEMFMAYMKNCLGPSLKKGDVVIMDNLSSHKVSVLEAIVKERGAKIEYLPPYSPDLNPVENMWSKIKAQLRQIKGRYIDRSCRRCVGYSYRPRCPRMVQALWLLFITLQVAIKLDIQEE